MAHSTGCDTCFAIVPLTPRFTWTGRATGVLESNLLGPPAQLSQNQLLMGMWAPSAAMQLGSPHSGCKYAARSCIAGSARGAPAAQPKPASDTAKLLHTLGAGQ